MDDNNKPDQSLKKNNVKSALRIISFILGLAIIYFGLIIAIIVGGEPPIPDLPVFAGSVFLGLIFIVLGRKRGLIVKIENNRLKIGIYKNYRENIKPNIVGIIASLVGIIASLFSFLFGIGVLDIGVAIGFLWGGSGGGTDMYMGYLILGVALFIYIMFSMLGVIGLILSLKTAFFLS